jgi:5'-nucleotidase
MIVFSVALFMIFGSAELFSCIDTLTVVHINDTHSRLVPRGPKDAQGQGTLGGIARAATVIGQIKMSEDNVLFLHAGDAFVGDFMFNKYFGVPELQILAQLGCDAMALGNHEFDLTPEILKLALGQAGFPIPGFDLLSANLDMTEDPALAALVSPYVIKDVGILKVGIFGLVTQEANEFSNPSPDSVTFFIDAAGAAVTDLRPQCDLIIGLTHIGFMQDSILAANVPGIDLIVGGHSHTLLEAPVGVTNPEGKTTWIVQAGNYYEHVGNMRLATSQSGMEILSYELIPVNNLVPEEPAIAAVVQTLVDDLENDPRYGPVYTQEIAEAANDIEKEYGWGYKDVPLGNLITDAYRDTTKTDVALAVWGFMSTKLYTGPLTGADIFQTVPYGYDPASGLGFKIMTFELTGLELWMGLEFTTEQAKLSHDFYVQVSGMTFAYDSSQPLGGKLRGVLIGDQALELSATYTVTTNSGLFDFLSYAGLEPRNPQDTGFFEYEVVRDFIIENSPVEYHCEGRIEDIFETPVVTPLAAQIPRSVELMQNYPNPFNPSTTIEFSIPRQSRVTIKIYNLLGRVVEILTDADYQPGHHRVIWNAGDAASGMYFCKLQAGNEALVRRMVLLR